MRDTSSNVKGMEFFIMKFFDEVSRDAWVDDGRSISRNVALLNILVHDVITYCFMKTEQTSKNIFMYKN